MFNGVIDKMKEKLLTSCKNNENNYFKKIMCLGLDFGTTNSTVCLFDGKTFYYVTLENEQIMIPTLLYVNKEYYPSYGELARTNFLMDNKQRTVRFEEIDLGYIQITLSETPFEMFEHTPFDPVPTTFDAKIKGYADKNLPGILFASTKRLLGQPSFVSIKLFEKNIKVEAIISSIIQNIKNKIETQYSYVEYSNIFIGRPVNYECEYGYTQEKSNSIALERMRKALENVNINNYEFFLEPIAPVLSYLHENHEDENLNILILDFGGGTLDFSLIEKKENYLTSIGNTGIPLGGDIINEILLKNYIFPELGLTQENLTYLRKNNIYFEDIIREILNWRTTYILNQPKYFIMIQDAMKLMPDEMKKFHRIYLLIKRNYSYNIFLAIENAKKELSSSSEYNIDLHEVDIHIKINRSMLESSIEPYIKSILTAIDSFLASKNLDTNDVDRVIVTGGTSIIPVINEELYKKFNGKIRKIDPFLSNIKGFALGAWLYSQGKILLNNSKLKINI